MYAESEDRSNLRAVFVWDMVCFRVRNKHATFFAIVPRTAQSFRRLVRRCG